MKKANLGFIVAGNFGPLGLSPHKPQEPDEKGVLWSNYLTVFATRREARKAMDRTRAYASARNYPWKCETNYIRKITSNAGFTK